MRRFKIELERRHLWRQQKLLKGDVEAAAKKEAIMQPLLDYFIDFTATIPIPGAKIIPDAAMAEVLGVKEAFAIESRFCSEEERQRGLDFLALAWIGSDPNRKVGTLAIGLRGRYVGERIECSMCAVRKGGSVHLGFQVLDRFHEQDGLQGLTGFKDFPVHDFRMARKTELTLDVPAELSNQSTRIRSGEESSQSDLASTPPERVDSAEPKCVERSTNLAELPLDAVPVAPFENPDSFDNLFDSVYANGIMLENMQREMPAKPPSGSRAELLPAKPAETMTWNHDQSSAESSELSLPTRDDLPYGAVVLNKSSNNFPFSPDSSRPRGAGRRRIPSDAGSSDSSQATSTRSRLAEKVRWDLPSDIHSAQPPAQSDDNRAARIFL
jgi:hypothetical protein